MKLYLPLALVAAVAVAQDFDAQAEAIVAKMTPSQWIGQMAQANIGVILGSDGQLSVNAVTQCAKAGVGSFLNGAMPAAKWRAMITQIQAIYKANNAPPALYGLDSVHGANYVNDAILSPQQINKGATFNAKIVQDSAFITARDTSAGGVNWVFAPGLDVTNHKRWSRVYETFGEDPYLASELGIAAVNGIQSVPGVAAAVKHFIGYGATSSGDDRAPAYLDDYQLLNYHAPPFIAAIQSANALSVMASYVSVNGVPMVANSRLTNDLLRSDIGFNGLLLTDWEDIYNLNYVHKLVSNNQDAVAMSMSKSSVDMSMIPNDLSFIGYAQNLLNAGTIAASRYRASAKRIIKMKLQLGLFETPVPGANNVNLVGGASDRQASLELARESIVLLKNKDRVLPIRSNASVFVTGPAHDNIGYLCGGWTWEWQGVSGNAKFPGSQSVLSAFQSLVAANGGKVTSLQGVDINGGTTDSLADAKAKAGAADYTVIVVGETPYAEMVGNVPDAALPAGQLQYIRDIASTGTKVILVLVEGRPRLLNGVADVVHAVIDAMLPCHMGGQAIAEIILGLTNPSGRLSMTYPKDQTKDNMVTPYFQRKNGVCVLTGAACPAEWEFGTGLSYTTFSYTNFALSGNQLNTSAESLTASVVVTNTGTMAGKEAVLLFLSQGARTSGTPETKMLKKFTKVSLSPGQSTTVTFSIGFNDFAIYSGGIGSGLLKSAEAGAYYVGVKPETVCDANTIGPLCQSFNYGAVAATIPLSLFAKTTGKIVGATDWDTFMYAPPTGATPVNQQLDSE
ncbi:hypothetical protein SDRG_01899 [Saprolegnia diclina VS20]|uniref:beta-glucosidase n=1 Tax=Saprolegnia diclina (strain VS20) TaxID=1156394 RepID=T0SD44_SAPDV|nr:hypothetical protein SDRG_01899 [Saprolegnia diclina VS20]EQC40832.1 hypothetical protein SDRG_01899 [Saprolegnia diclina VS20]|eukprot:XP_008605676.1 hypothetical protein SDRG_01899 [Saprolegnia diclina VS20]